MARWNSPGTEEEEADLQSIYDQTLRADFDSRTVQLKQTKMKTDFCIRLGWWNFPWKMKDQSNAFLCVFVWPPIQGQTSHQTRTVRTRVCNRQESDELLTVERWPACLPDAKGLKQIRKERSWTLKKETRKRQSSRKELALATKRKIKKVNCCIDDTFLPIFFFFQSAFRSMASSNGS